MEFVPTRRRVLAGTVALAGSLAGCTTAEEEETPTATESMTQMPVDTLVSVDGDRVPESLTLGPDGALYFGITAGELRRVPAGQVGMPDMTVADTEQVATLPGALGVEAAPDGTVYVAVANRGEDNGVWSVSPDGETRHVVALDGFPNDVHYDEDRDRLFVTDSNGGVVYAVTPDGSQTTWLEDDRLSTDGFGANGLTRLEDTLYVAVTSTAEGTGRLLRVPIADDGTAGEAALFLEDSAILGADGITTHGSDIYVAANSQDRVVRVSQDGATDVVADSEDGLVSPSDVLFGSGEMADFLFICNFAPNSPADAGILGTTVP